MEKRKIYGTIIGVFVFVLLLLGLTYAYFYWSSGNEKTNVNLTVTRSIEGLIVYNQGTSILGTDNYTLQPSSSYTGGISATIEFWKVASATQNIYGQISFEVLQMLSRYNTTDANIGKSDTIKWAVTTYTATNSTETLLKEGTFNGRKQGDKFALVSNISLNNYQTFYKIYIWMDENATDPNYSVASELLSTEISASATDVMYQFDSPALTTLTNLGITPKPDYLTTFTGISTDADTGVYVTEDDLGPSYYFRGNVTNNYVKFGKNSSNQDMYWRIIRINGDGTIRMIYDGTQVHQNGTASTDRQVGTSVFNTNNGDNAFVGYMNGTVNGTTFPNGTSNSISYAEAHANRYNSTIKTYLESWYRTNIDYTGYSNKVADAIYCNDRSISSGDGFGTSTTDYNVYYGRYSSGTWSPTLICPQTNDKFTKEEALGNGKLTYPVGLITTDEVVFAGGYASSHNTSYYLYTGNWYWTMSPNFFDSGIAFVLNVISEGSADSASGVGGYNSVRPVISLKANAITGGTGAPGSPFTT